MNLVAIMLNEVFDVDLQRRLKYVVLAITRIMIAHNWDASIYTVHTVKTK